MAYSLWVTVAEADQYLLNERLHADEYWASDTNKSAALTMAQKTIVSSDMYEFTTPDSGGAYADIVKEAICEQALFLIANPDIGMRGALQAQGVVRAGIVQEAFRDDKDDWRKTVPICQEARDKLKNYRKHGMGFKFTAPE